jgi:hypothetical protein
MKKTHYSTSGHRYTNKHYLYCGTYVNPKIYGGTKTPITNNKSKVTCKRCKIKINNPSKTTYAVHYKVYKAYKSSFFSGYSRQSKPRCGIWGYLSNRNLTLDKKKVTCKRCIANLNNPPKEPIRHKEHPSKNNYTACNTHAWNKTVQWKGVTCKNCLKQKDKLEAAPCKHRKQYTVLTKRWLNKTFTWHKVNTVYGKHLLCINQCHNCDQELYIKKQEAERTKQFIKKQLIST